MVKRTTKQNRPAPQPTDVLIVGGTAPQTQRAGLKVQHVPFSFAGLGEAYGLVPECHTVVFLPDQQILKAMPDPRALACFLEPRTVHPIVVELGLLSPASDEPVRAQISSSLKRISDEKQPAFIRRAASAFLRHVFDRTFSVVHGGGSVYVLIPTDWPSLLKEKQTFLQEALPGIRISTEEAWSARVSGEYMWLLAGARSHLCFDLSGDYETTLEEEGYSSVPDPLPHPERILTWLPDEVPVHMAAGAVDRAGHHRVLVLRWGAGEFIVAPTTGLQAVLTHLQPAADAPARTGRRKPGRKPAGKDEKAEDKRIVDRWLAISKGAPARPYIRDFAREQGIDEQKVRQALDRHRKREAALRATRR